MHTAILLAFDYANLHTPASKLDYYDMPVGGFPPTLDEGGWPLLIRNTAEGAHLGAYTAWAWRLSIVGSVT